MLRNSILAVAASVASLGGWAQAPLYVSPDVATDPDGPPTYFPWEVVEHISGGPAFYSLEFAVPGDPAVDGLHKQDAPGRWLFSVEAPADFPGFLAKPQDVVRRMGAGLFTPFFDGSCVNPPIPDGTNVDALFQLEDSGELFVAFDVPVTFGAATILPSEIVSWTPTGPLPCGWTLGGSAFDLAAVSTTYSPDAARITGADLAATKLLISFDIPVDLAPSIGPTTYLPGQIAAFDLLSGNWELFEDLQTQGAPGWPVSSEVAAMTCEANPGRIDSPATQIRIDKSLPDVTILCPGGCSSGGRAYGIYEGTLANVRMGIYDHVSINCGGVCPGANTFVPGVGDRYYLVVPHNFKEEGSYGLALFGVSLVERPQAANPIDRCVESQNLTPCP